MPTGLKITAVAVVCLVVGYFAGREHLKYEVRSAMRNAASELQNGLAAAFGGDAKSTKRAASKPSLPLSEPESKPQPLTVQLLKKGFHDGTYDDAVTFSLEFANASEKDIRAFDGVLRFTDLLDNQIISIRLEINERVAHGGSLKWEGSMDYNQFTDSHQRLRSEPQENLKVSFLTNKVLFADGETKTFD